MEDKKAKLLDTFSEPVRAQILRESGEVLQTEKENRQKKEDERNKHLDALIGKIPTI